MTSIYPKLPGNIIYHDPTIVDFKKISSTQLEKVMNNEAKLKSNIIIPRVNTPEKIQVRDGKSLSYSQSTYQNPFGTDLSQHFQPDWVKLDKQVLRFYGYFKESIVESRKENSRLRKLTIYYYLTDDTISIFEERETNSGIIQGIFLKRLKVRKDENSNSHYLYTDLIVGNDIYVYGRYIRLFDCDDYTREFYSVQGLNQPSKIDLPMDQFHESQKAKVIQKRDNSMKDYLEHKLGGGKIHSQKQFLENDRKVLKFNAKYDGLNYIIHYFLADDTVEIREIHQHNSGRDPFPIFLKRRKLPRKFSITQPGNITEADFYKDSDIDPNMTLWAFNRPFKILGCDEYTAKHYLENYNKVFPVGGFDQIYQIEKTERVIPPYNGWGDEKDSIGNCLRLIPKQPKKDYYKYIDNDAIILRYLARLNSKSPEDADRKFLISFFLSDDSIQIYEIPKKNSGVWEGKLLERGKYKNEENNFKPFTISDFEINKSMKINSFSFYIMDADEFTKKWLTYNME